MNKIIILLFIILHGFSFSQDQYRNYYYSAFNESNNADTFIRILEINSFSPSRVITFTKVNGEWTILYKKAKTVNLNEFIDSSKPAYDSVQIDLSESIKSKISSLINDSFYSLNEESPALGNDGFSWIIEIKEGSKYKKLNRWANHFYPEDSSLVKVCSLLKKQLITSPIVFKIRVVDLNGIPIKKVKINVPEDRHNGKTNDKGFFTCMYGSIDMADNPLEILLTKEGFDPKRVTLDVMKEEKVYEFTMK